RTVVTLPTQHRLFLPPCYLRRRFHTPRCSTRGPLVTRIRTARLKSPSTSALNASGGNTRHRCARGKPSAVLWGFPQYRVNQLRGNPSRRVLSVAPIPPPNRPAESCRDTGHTLSRPETRWTSPAAGASSRSSTCV